MIKEYVKVKELLSEAEKINMTNFLFDGYFLSGQNGEIIYTPYFREINKRTAFFLYAVEGLTFEEQKDEYGNAIIDETGESVMESVYDCSVTDTDLRKLYDGVFSSQNNTYAGLKLQLEQIDTDVRDMVEFKKLQIIHTKKDSLSELLSMFTRKLDSLDLNDLNLEESIRTFQTLGKKESSYQNE